MSRDLLLYSSCSNERKQYNLQLFLQKLSGWAPCPHYSMADVRADAPGPHISSLCTVCAAASPTLYFTVSQQDFQKFISFRISLYDCILNPIHRANCSALCLRSHVHEWQQQQVIAASATVKNSRKQAQHQQQRPSTIRLFRARKGDPAIASTHLCRPSTKCGSWPHGTSYVRRGMSFFDRQ